MPRYDYICEDNGQQVEVSHGYDEVVETWGELCFLTGMEPGDTPAATPVTRMLNTGVSITGGSSPSPSPTATTCR